MCVPEAAVFPWCHCPREPFPASWAPSGTQSWCQSWFCLGRGAGQAGATLPALSLLSTSQARMSWREDYSLFLNYIFFILNFGEDLPCPRSRREVKLVRATWICHPPGAAQGRLVFLPSLLFGKSQALGALFLPQSPSPHPLLPTGTCLGAAVW